MSRTLTTSIAMTAMLALLAGPGLAQQATPAPAASAPAATAPVTLPPALQAAGLTDVISKPARHGGTKILGKLPDGSKVSALIDGQGKLLGLRAGDGAVLPWALTDQMLPQAVRENAIFSEIDGLSAVFIGDRGIMLAGQDGDKNHLRAAFAQDGTLLRFGRADKEGRHFGDDDDDDDDDHRKGRDRGDRHDDRRDRWRGGDHDHRDRAAPPPPPPQQQGALLPQPGTVRQALTAAGYEKIGEITRDGHRVMAMAINPEGEPVMVELNAQAQVTREINR